MKAKEYYAKFFGHFNMTEINPEDFWEALKLCMTEFIDEQAAASKSVHSEASKLAKFREFERRWISLSEMIEKAVENNTQIYHSPEERTRLPLELKKLMRSYIITRSPLLAAALGY